MFRFLSSHRVLLVGVLTGFVCLFPLNGFAGALPTGERTVGNATIEPAYNDFTGTFNCMGAPGNCPDHGGVIAGVATSVMPGVYGANPSAVPGHDHLVGMPHSGDFNVPWHVYVELFTSSSAVTHITTLAELQAAWASGGVRQLDSGITFVCAVVSENTYLAGTSVA